jgi:hypothetical protein
MSKRGFCSMSYVFLGLECSLPSITVCLSICLQSARGCLFPRGVTNGSWDHREEVIAHYLLEPLPLAGPTKSSGTTILPDARAGILPTTQTRTRMRFKGAILWDVTPCSPVEAHRRSGGTQFLRSCSCWLLSWLILRP